MTATVISLILAHIGYYAYVLLISHMMDIHGKITNTRNLDIFKFRTSHSVNICTYQNDASRNGFAWFKTIYLNEKLTSHTSSQKAFLGVLPRTLPPAKKAQTKTSVDADRV